MSTFMVHVHREPAPVEERIVLDEHGKPTCPRTNAGIPHARHSNAVWFDMHEVESWICTGSKGA